MNRTGFGFGQGGGRDYAARVLQRFGRKVRNRNAVLEVPMTELDRDEDGRPVSITVTAERVGNDDSILFDLRRLLMQRVEERVLAYYPRLGRRVLPYVRGFLTVTNHNTGATRVARTGAASRNYKDIRILDMEDLLEYLGGSDEQIDQLNLEWSFQIAWPEDVPALVRIEAANLFRR